jgi:peptide/nickel transport system substrate-binding protein
VPAQTIVLEAADNGLFKPQIPTVVFKLVPDATAILNGLAAGEAQVSTQIGLDVDQSPELDKLAQEGKIKPYYIPASAWEHIDFNLMNEILADKNVRKAIAHAVDRKSIVDKRMFGKSVVMHSWIAPPHWAIDESAIIKYDYNPEKAKALLDQAGWKVGADGIREKDGKKLRLKLQTTTAKIRTLITPIVQDNLKQVGIAIEPEHLPGRGLFENNGPLMTHTFELGLYTWISDPDPSPNELYLSKNCPEGANYPCFKNEEFDKLGLQQASELSQAKRKEIISKMLKIWTDELPSLPLFQRLSVTAASPKLENFKPTPSQTPETWNIHEWFLPAS